LTEGNKALRKDQNYEAAIVLYLKALLSSPGLANTITANIKLANFKRRAARPKTQWQKVVVCGWELSHNAAGRVYTLAQLYQTFADVEIIGTLFPNWGRELWEPIRDTDILVHSFVVDDESRFHEQLIALVVSYPYDIVHLAKPRMPTIFFGLLYKLIWDAKVLMDIDDEELAFVKAESPISVDDYLKQNGRLPDLNDLAGKDWTRLAVGLAKEFDAITVANSALQQRYGGDIIRHARDEKLFQPSPELKQSSRKKYGVAVDKKVVLFFGTPRAHKGLLETAEAISASGSKNVVFVIAVGFPEAALKQKLQEVKGVEYLFLGPNLSGMFRKWLPWAISAFCFKNQIHWFPSIKPRPSSRTHWAWA
jgi:glycosyltransferase involved in cell wall biosynthesis